MNSANENRLRQFFLKKVAMKRILSATEKNADCIFFTSQFLSRVKNLHFVYINKKRNIVSIEFIRNFFYAFFRFMSASEKAEHIQ